MTKHRTKRTAKRRTTNQTKKKRWMDRERDVAWIRMDSFCAHALLSEISREKKLRIAYICLYSSLHTNFSNGTFFFLLPTHIFDKIINYICYCTQQICNNKMLSMVQESPTHTHLCQFFIFILISFLVPFPFYLTQ